MFRLIGRILLGIAAGLLLYAGITGLINSIQDINNNGGWGAVFQGQYWSNLIVLAIAGLEILLALPAVYGVIRGKCGFWMLIFAILLGGTGGYGIYVQIQTGNLNNAAAIWDFIVSLAIPLCYAGGTIFILLRRRGSSH